MTRVVGECVFLALGLWRGRVARSPASPPHRDSRALERTANHCGAGDFPSPPMPRRNGLFGPLQGPAALLYAARSRTGFAYSSVAQR
jgi:hypothetical protein